MRLKGVDQARLHLVPTVADTVADAAAVTDAVAVAAAKAVVAAAIDSRFTLVAGIDQSWQLPRHFYVASSPGELLLQLQRTHQKLGKVQTPHVNCCIRRQ